MLVTCETSVEIADAGGVLRGYAAGEAFEFPDDEAKAKIEVGLFKAANKTQAAKADAQAADTGDKK